jgi:myo-inositol-1(or 4)-monophosphatase
VDQIWFQVLMDVETALNLGAAELKRYFGRTKDIRTKADESVVTEADFASEKAIIAFIRGRYPDHVILAEESHQTLIARSGQVVWIIDPLDGTSNFANNYPYFCVSIGVGVVAEQNRIEMMVGGVCDPIRDLNYTALSGQGAFRNGKRMQIREPAPVNKQFLVTGFAYSKGEQLDQDVEIFRKISQLGATIRRDGAAALDMALVADGVFHGFWEWGLKPWDVAAGEVLVREAGGAVCNYPNPKKLDSQGFDVFDGSTICGHAEVVETIKRLM